MSSPLTALSPLDGRYASKTRALQDHFSEFALIRSRVRVEVEWLKALAAEASFTALPALAPATLREVDALVAGFSIADAERIKAIEATTNHDVKAVEYWLRERFASNAEVSAANDASLPSAMSHSASTVTRSRMSANSLKWSCSARVFVA